MLCNHNFDSVTKQAEILKQITRNKTFVEFTRPHGDFLSGNSEKVV